MTHHDDAAPEDTEDRFYAQFDSREVELMTLDELQAAFEAGQIHGNTFVCREGDSEWLTLAELAGLGEEEEPAAAPVAPVAGTRPPMPARGPDLGGAGETRPPMPNRRPDMPASAETRPPMPERRPAMVNAPAARAPIAYPPVSSMAQSYAPVTSNIAYAELDLDESALRPKRRWGLILAAAAALALAGGGAAFALSGGGGALASAVPSTAALQAAASHSQASLSLSNIQTKPSEPVAPPPALPSTPEPAAVAAAATPAPASDAPKAAAGFGEDMKQALLAADKTRLSKHAAKVKARAPAAAAPRRSKPTSAPGLKSGGSAYDPLNGKL